MTLMLLAAVLSFGFVSGAERRDMSLSSGLGLGGAFITQDMGIAEIADKVYRMEDGILTLEESKVS